MVLTEKGFLRPGYNDLLTAQINRAKQLFGEDIDTSEQSVLGKYIRINVYDLAECYELLEDIYYARFPNTARGQSLKRLCVFAGIRQNAAVASRLRVRFKGNAGAAVPSGFLISGGGVEFYVNDEYILGADGTAEAYANCTEDGPKGNIPSESIMGIVKPDAGIESVELLAIVTYGKEAENDASLRIRFSQAVAGAGSASVDALNGALSRVPLVDGVAIIENDTEEIKDGRPPHSFECYVLAPKTQDQLVAEAIFSKKPLGIKSVGNVEVQVLDRGGKPHLVRFSRTVKKEIYIRASVLVNQFFETGGVDRIKDSLMEYINNLANGEPVYLSGLYGYIHDIHGVVNVQSLTVSGDGTAFGADNIPVDSHEVARISADHIEIGVV